MKLSSLNGDGKIVIAGAGPGGTSLAIRLARAGLSVTIVERSEFPRHKLCGEFISPECLGQFEALGVLDSMRAAAGDQIGETVFYSRSGRSASIPSEWFSYANPALGLSRFEMDRRLLDEARRAGAEVLEGRSVTGVQASGDAVEALEIRSRNGERESISGRYFIDATGRAAVLAGLFRKKKPVRGTRRKAGYVGFKAHFADVEMPPGRCEIYLFDGGYGGLNFVEGGNANHCFLVRADVAKRFGGDADTILNEAIFKNARARETLAGAVRRFAWLAVAVSSFGFNDPAPASNLFAVGDSSAFIDPFTGSGMLVALQSAEALSALLTEEGSDAENLTERYRAVHRKLLRRRLGTSSFIRSLSRSPVASDLAVAAIGRCKTLRRLLASNTRSASSATFRTGQIT